MLNRELQATLAWLALPHLGERSLQALLGHMRESRTTLADLWHAPTDELRDLVGLHQKALAALETRGAEIWTEAGAELQELRAWGVDLLLAGQPEYPSVLQAVSGRRWPYLFAYGALGLLEVPRVVIANSRTVSTAGLTITDAVADALARRDIPLVSSTNRTSYQVAATAAKRHAGPSVLVLDRGIKDASPTGLGREPVATARVWDAAFDPDLQLLLSPFPWRYRWTARSGPHRDALVFDLADVVVAVEVRGGGNIDRECRRAAEQGKRVIAVDQGEDTEPGTRALWEDLDTVVRLPWARGGVDATVREVLRSLPGQLPEVVEAAPRAGWQREVAQFLARACHLLTAQVPGPAPARLAVAGYPARGVLAATAARWSASGADHTTGAHWLLADLQSSGESAPRVGQFLQRVARGGFLAAIVPADWLENPQFAAERDRWLQQASLCLIARLPHYPGDTECPPSAAIILQRDGWRREEAPIFVPEHSHMGRFHLRRYLQEVLIALSERHP